MKSNQKPIAYVVIFFFAGLWIGSALSSFSHIKTNNEIAMLHHSIEFSDASMDLILHDQLVKGEIDDVKESLLDNYQKTKMKANSLDLEKLAKENWPFTVDAWFVDNLKNDINRLNTPYPCKNKLASNSIGGCNG